MGLERLHAPDAESLHSIPLTGGLFGIASDAAMQGSAETAPTCSVFTTAMCE